MSKQIKRAGASARRRPFASGSALLVAVGALVLALTLIPAGAAGSSNKTLKATITPSVGAPAGASVGFVLWLENDTSSPNQLGSANVTLPTGFTITGASSCADSTCGSTSPLPSGSVFGNPLQLRSLGIAPGGFRYFLIQATTPCSDPGNLKWKIDAKQSNDFSGPPGNTFSNSPYYIGQSLSGTCKLAFVNQPKDTAVNTEIRDQQWGSIRTPQTGSAIQVEVVDGLGHQVTSGVSGTVTLNCTVACANNAEQFVNGVATFTNLAIGTSGTGDSFSASAPGYQNSDQSSSFNVDPVELFFRNQPTNTVVSTAIRDVQYGSLATPNPAGSPITVGVQVRSLANASAPLQISGSGTVTIKATGPCLTQTPACALSGNTAIFGNGGDNRYAVFGNMTGTAVTTGYQLSATETGTYADSAPSSFFNVDQFGVYCGDPNNCSLPNSSDNQKYSDSNAVQTTGAQTITLDYNTSPGGGLSPDAVCYAEVFKTYVDKQGNRPSGATILIGPASGFQGTSTTTIQHTVNKHWVQLFPNNGNPFIDICMGAQRIDLTGMFTGGVPGPVACTPDQNGGHDPFGGGWTTKNGTPAVCAGDGNYYGIIGSFQQPIPSTDPQITAWSSDASGNRIFTISMGTPAQQLWIWDQHMLP
jgi:hypothetical protein